MSILDQTYGLNDQSGAQLSNDTIANILRQQGLPKEAPAPAAPSTPAPIDVARPPGSGSDGPQPVSTMQNLDLTPAAQAKAPWQETDWQKQGHDKFYRGAIPQTHVMYTLGDIADVGLPVAAAVGAHMRVRSLYGDSQLYGIEQTQGLVDTLQNSTRSLERVITRAHQTEFDDITRQMRTIAGRVGGNPRGDSNWLSLDRSVMTESERTVAERWRQLRFPGVGEGDIAAARAATDNPEIQTLLTERQAAFTAARTEYQTAFGEATSFANAMTRNSIGGLAVGELADFAMDRTVFKDTPHSLRTVISDMVAPAIVFTNFSLPVKAGVIAGTHLLNRYLDSQNPDTGKF